MKKTKTGTAPGTGSAGVADVPGNGHGQVNSPGEPTTAELGIILASLQRMQEGDFSVRLPGSWVGLPGKIADTFNDIVAANEQMADELKRVGQAVGKEGRTRERTRLREAKGAWGEMEISVNTLVDDLLRPTTEVTRAIAAVAQGNLNENSTARRGRPPARRRIPPLRQHRQHHDSAAERLHFRSHARGPRSRHRRQARRPGGCARRRRHLEGPHRLGQLRWPAT